VVFLKVFHLLLFFKSFVVGRFKKNSIFQIAVQGWKIFELKRGDGIFFLVKKNKEKVNGGCFIFLFRGFLGLLGHYFVI